MFRTCLTLLQHLAGTTVLTGRGPANQGGRQARETGVMGFEHFGDHDDFGGLQRDLRATGVVIPA
jgi:hypothetical protein